MVRLFLAAAVVAWVPAVALADFDDHPLAGHPQALSGFTGSADFVSTGTGGSVLHVTVDTNPLDIGDDVTIGHSCILHGCTIKDRSLIGMGSVVLDGAVVGPDAMVGAGSVVKMGDVVPPGTLYLGVPARYRRDLTPEEIAALLESAEEYAKFAAEYLDLSI